MTPYEQAHGDRGKEKHPRNRKKILEGPDSGTDTQLLRRPVASWVWAEGDRIIDTLWERVFKHSNKHTPLVQPKPFAK